MRFLNPVLMPLVLPLLLPLLLPGTALPALAANQHYCNTKYSYCLEIPDTLRPQREPPAHDGLEFCPADGQGKLLVWGSWNVLSQTLGQHLVEARKGRKVTYQRQFKDYYVLSGYEGTQVFYQKTVLEKGRFRTVLFLYPPSRKVQFDPLIAPVINSFVSVAGR